MERAESSDHDTITVNNNNNNNNNNKKKRGVVTYLAVEERNIQATINDQMSNIMSIS